MNLAERDITPEMSRGINNNNNNLNNSSTKQTGGNRGKLSSISSILPVCHIHKGME
jgi:hypothetical protein